MVLLVALAGSRGFADGLRRPAEML